VTILSMTVFAAGLTAGLIVAGAVWAFARSALTERATELAARNASLGLLQQELSGAQQQCARLAAELEAERRAAAARETSLRETFAALSHEALERNNRTFLDLAQT
jgi:DNA recombination protein RmuC